MNQINSSAYEPVLIEPNVGVKTFSSMSELQSHVMNGTATTDLLLVLETRAYAFVGVPHMTDRLKVFAEKIIAECVAKALTP